MQCKLAFKTVMVFILHSLMSPTAFHAYCHPIVRTRKKTFPRETLTTGVMLIKNPRGRVRDGAGGAAQHGWHHSTVLGSLLVLQCCASRQQCWVSSSAFSAPSRNFPVVVGQYFELNVALLAVVSIRGVFLEFVSIL